MLTDRSAKGATTSVNTLLVLLLGLGSDWSAEMTAGNLQLQGAPGTSASVKVPDAFFATQSPASTEPCPERTNRTRQTPARNWHDPGPAAPRRRACPGL